MTAAVYLEGDLSWIYHHKGTCILTRKHDHQVVREHRIIGGGDDMPCGVGTAEICLPHRGETSGGKSAGAIAIYLRRAKRRN